MYVSILTSMESGRVSQPLLVITYVYNSPFFYSLLCTVNLKGWLEVTERKDDAQASKLFSSLLIPKNNQINSVTSVLYSCWP